MTFDRDDRPQWPARGFSPNQSSEDAQKGQPHKHATFEMRLLICHGSITHPVAGLPHAFSEAVGPFDIETWSPSPRGPSDATGTTDAADFLQHAQGLLTPGAQIRYSFDTPLPQAYAVRAFHSAEVADVSPIQTLNLPQNLPQNLPLTPQQGTGVLPAADGLCWVGSLEALRNELPILSIRTADCLAVALVASWKNLRLAALVHAGWRGYTSGIHFNALALLEKNAAQLGCDWAQVLPRIEIFISPAIFGETYPCGEDVLAAIDHHVHTRLSGLSGFKAVQPAFTASRNMCSQKTLGSETASHQKIFPDLQLMAVCDLVAIGIDPARISVFRENTFGHPFLPSYRQACQKGTNLGRRLVTHLAWTG